MTNAETVVSKIAVGAVTSFDGVLTLYAPTIPGSTQTKYPPFKPDHPLELHCCLSIDRYQDDPKGKLVLVDPWVGIEALQDVALFVNNREVDSHTVLPGQESESIRLYIKPGHLVSTADNEVKYVVTRPSGNKDQSASVLLRYQAPRVGGEDSDTVGDEIHSELYLELPADVIKNGIDADRAEQGVVVKVLYPVCREYDTIELDCHGEPVKHLVTKLEADSGEPVEITVGKETFEQAGDNKKFLFKYSVVDQCTNQPQPPFSAGIEIDVDLAGRRLLAPILREVPTNDEDDASVIDLGTLGANNLSVIIATDDLPFMKDDRIIAKYIAKAEGQPDVVVVVEGTVETQFGQKKPCILEIPNDKVVSAQTVTVTYELKRNDVLIATSKPAEAQVIGEAVIVPPVITRVTDSKGEIDNGGTTTETSITITGSASAGQKVQLYDGDAPIGGELTAVGGIWTATISVAVGVRRLTAKALYGSGQVSAAWVVNVTLTVDVEDFEQQPLKTITSVGAKIITPVLEFELLSIEPYGRTTGGITENAYGNPGKQLSWYIMGSETAEIVFFRPCQKLTFRFTGNIPSALIIFEIEFYGSGGLLGSKTIYRAEPWEVEFSGLNINRMRLFGKIGAGILFDEFKLY